MWIVKQIIEWVVEKVFYAYYKKFRYAGILFLLFLAECIALICYRSDAITSINIYRSDTVIADAVQKSYEENPDVLEYELLLENVGSRKNQLFSIVVEDLEGNIIPSETKNVYKKIGDWAGVGGGDIIYVPAGSQARVTVLIDRKDMDSVRTDSILFKLGWEKEASCMEVKLP